MPRRNRCDDPDHMAMPCRCACGKWCELEDMDSLNDDDDLVCPECLHDQEKRSGF